MSDESDCGPTPKKLKQSKICFGRAEPARVIASLQSSPPVVVSVGKVSEDKTEVSKVVEIVTTKITEDKDNHHDVISSSTDKADNQTESSVSEKFVASSESISSVPFHLLSNATSKKSTGYKWAKFGSERRGGSDKRRIVQCTVCIMYPDIVKIHIDRNHRIPAICSKDGAVFRKTLMEDHDKSTCHKSCTMRLRQLNAIAEGRTNEGDTELEVSLRFLNSKLEKKAAKMMIDVFMDAKRGSLSAWSYPARYVASLMGELIDLNAKHQTFAPSESDLQYVTPHCHRDMLLTITETDRRQFSVELRNSLALSLRIDGAVDKQRLDNKHIMAKYVTIEGESRSVYLGFQESDERGSVGLHKALQQGAAKCGMTWTNLFALTTSIVTDGASENTGVHHSLWSLLSKDRLDDNKSANLPLLKIWCAVHRSQLAFKDMTRDVPEVSVLISDCKAVTSYFNSSALRTKELKKAALDTDSEITQFPTVKDIRFTEYSHAMLSSILRNHKPMIRYLEASESAEDKGLLNKWLDEDTIRIAACLCDVLYLYKRFQKCIQGDHVTVFDLANMRDHCHCELLKVIDRPLPGGFEERIELDLVEKTKQLQDEREQRTFCGVKLQHKRQRPTVRRHLFVTTKGRDVNAIKSEIILSLCNFLKTRLGVEISGNVRGLSHAIQLEALSPACLKAADATEESINEAYLAVVPDLKKSDFFAAYGELVSTLPSSRATTLQEILKVSLSNEEWITVSTAIARIIAAKPHSCDVERLISAYNILKDDDRCSLAANTIDAYMHVHVNMCVLSEFNVRPALKMWLDKAKRRIHSCKKATSQEWFKDVFSLHGQE